MDCVRSGCLRGRVSLLSEAAGKCERLVVTGSPDAPPLLWRDPQDPTHLIGATADLLQQVAQDLGLKIDLLYGGKRSQALDEVRSGRMDMLADAPLNSRRAGNPRLPPPGAGADRLSRLDPQGLGAGLRHGRPTCTGIKGAVSEQSPVQSRTFETFAGEQLDPATPADPDSGVPETAAGGSGLRAGGALLRHGHGRRPWA